MFEGWAFCVSEWVGGFFDCVMCIAWMRSEFVAILNASA